MPACCDYPDIVSHSDGHMTVFACRNCHTTWTECQPIEATQKEDAA